MKILHNIPLPIENPVLIFAIMMLIILLSPIVLRRFKIPHIIGMIAAGILLGPNGLGILARDSSIELYGTVGMLYIMFLSGVEADVMNFRRDRNAGVVFGAFTFCIPMLLGIASSIFFLNLDIKMAMLLASVYASHTLVAYPIVSKYGVTKTRSVNIAVMGTIITNILSLLVFAGVESSLRGGETFWHWLQFGLSVMAFGAVVIFVFPLIAQHFFKKYTDNVIQYIFVMALMLFAAFISELAGIEAIIGAFLAGIALNQHIPSTSGLMNRIEFVGNAIFIPYFLISVGMIVDVNAFIDGENTLKIAALMTIVATAAKYLAAISVRRIFALQSCESSMIFGLSNAQAAATLAIITVCTKEGWLSHEVFYGTIVMIMVTCLISSVVVERAAHGILAKKDGHGGTQGKGGRFLIAMSNVHTIERLLALAAMVRNSRSKEPLFALHVTDRQMPDAAQSQYSKELLETAAGIASGTDIVLKRIAREDDTIATGIVNTCAEQNISDIIMGIGTANIHNAMFRIDVASVLRRTCQGTFLAKLVQPLNTIKRIVVAAPPQAEYEAGFSRWLYRLSNLHRQTQAKLVFYASEATAEKINIINARNKSPLKLYYHRFDDWQNFLILASHLHTDDLFVCVLARRDSLSYLPDMERIPSLLSNYFRDHNILIIYPEQYQSSENANQFV